MDDSSAATYFDVNLRLSFTVYDVFKNTLFATKREVYVINLSGFDLCLDSNESLSVSNKQIRQ